MEEDTSPYPSSYEFHLTFYKASHDLVRFQHKVIKP